MRKNHGWAAFWQKKQYIIAGTLVILAAVGMTVLYSRGQEQERKQLEQEIAAEIDTENQNVAMEERLNKLILENLAKYNEYGGYE